MLTLPAGAQSFLSASVFPVAGSPYNLASGDFNGDGKQDIVFQDAHTGGNLHIMLGNGDGTFATGQVIPITLGTGACITVGDINNDGVPDLVLGYDGFDQSASNFYPYVITVLVGKGDGTFGAPIASYAFSPDEPEQMLYHVGIADFDGDGHPDIAYSDDHSSIFFLKGDGTGAFTPMPRTPGDSGYPPFEGHPEIHGIAVALAADVSAADLNGDGRPDITTEGFLGMYVALNQGGASFPVITNPSPFLNNGFAQNAFKLQDINGDGVPDIVLAAAYGDITVFLGSPDGTFAAPRTVGSTPNEYAIIAIADLNGDGRPDLLLDSLDGIVSLTQGADGTFPASTRRLYAPGDLGGNEAQFADFDGDGRADIVSGGTNALVLTHGNADGSFQAAASYSAGSTEDVTPVDLNRDGNLDVVLELGGDGYYSTGSTWSGLGDGTFTQALQDFGSGAVTNGHSAIADFDGDGNPDLFNGGNVFYGDGSGGFGNVQDIAPMQTNNRPGGFVAIADFNEDGVPDGITTAIADYYTATSALSIAISRSGSSAYTNSFVTLAESPGPLAAGDFNHDGHIDLAVLGSSSLFILNGDGKGNLTLAQTYATGYNVVASNSSTYTDLEAADLDGDGNLDLVVPVAGQSLLEVFYGRGDGTFEPPVKMPLSADTWYVTMSDLNHDGIPDFIFSGHGLVRVLHGTGTRQFPVLEQLFAANVSTGKVRIADVNNDGSPDLLVPNGGGDSFNYPGDTFTVLLNHSAPPSPDALSGRLACTPEPSAYQQIFTCTATFIPEDNPAAPSGQVTFTIDGTNAGEAPLVSSSASFTIATTLSIGQHQILASFPGDSVYKPATAAATHTVSEVTPTIALVAAPTRVSLGDTVTLTATLSRQVGTPTGTVSFYDGSTLLQAVSVAANSQATLPVSNLALGTHSITATYSGDSQYVSVTSAAVSVEVDAGATATVLSASPTTAYISQPVLLKAVITDASGTPTGTVTFYDGVASLGTAPVDATGTATYSETMLGLGVRTITAIYSGNSTLASSTSNPVTVTIVPAQSTISLTSSPNPSYQSQSVLFTAIVNGPAGVRPADGVVQFSDGTTVLGQAPYSATGTFSITYTQLSPGSHLITAAYLGDPAFLPSVSAPVTQVVNASDFTVAVDPASFTLKTQHHGDVAVTLTALGIFSGEVSLACGPLPPHATCIFKSAQTALDTASGPQRLDMYLDTSDILDYTTDARAPGTRVDNTTWLAGLIFPLAGFLLLPRRRKDSRRNMRRHLTLLSILALVSLASIGCTGRIPSSVAPGTYAIPIVARSGAITHSATLTLNVTP